MTSTVIVVGAGGFGRETLDVIEAHNAACPEEALEVLGVADDAPSELNLQRLTARGYAYLGSSRQAFESHPHTAAIVAIGSPRARKAVAGSLAKHGVDFASVCHPSAIIGSQFQSGTGYVICGGALISTNVQLGDHVHLNPGVIVGHDSRLGDHVSVNPGAVISGECTVGDQVLVGASSVILQGLAVGQAATVGAAACVTKDVSPDTVNVGVPSRRLERP